MNYNLENKKQTFYEELNLMKEKKFIDNNVYENISSSYNKMCIDRDNYYKNQNNSMQRNQNIKKDKNVQGINILLLLGILTISFSGLIFATTTWLLLPDIFKPILLILISLGFFGLSNIVLKRYNIKQTSYAFWILGSIMIPITILSIGYFKLLGNYLSLEGEGSYLFAFLGSIVSLIVYIYSLKKYNNKLFKNIIIINGYLTYLFLLLFIDVNIPVLLLLFNIVITYFLYKYNNIKIIRKEFVIYSGIINGIIALSLILDKINLINTISFGLLILMLFMYVFAYNYKEYIFEIVSLSYIYIYKIIFTNSFDKLYIILFPMLSILLYMLFRNIFKKEKEKLYSKIVNIIFMHISEILTIAYIIINYRVYRDYVLLICLSFFIFTIINYYIAYIDNLISVTTIINLLFTSMIFYSWISVEINNFMDVKSYVFVLAILIYFVSYIKRFIDNKAINYFSNSHYITTIVLLYISLFLNILTNFKEYNTFMLIIQIMISLYIIMKDVRFDKINNIILYTLYPLSYLNIIFYINYFVNIEDKTTIYYIFILVFIILKFIDKRYILMSIFLIIGLVFVDNSIIPYLILYFIMYLLYLDVKLKPLPIKCLKTAVIINLLNIYYHFINSFNYNKLYEKEIILIPIVLIVFFILYKVWNEDKYFLGWLSLGVISITLFLNAIDLNSSIIFLVAGVIGVLVGFRSKIKSLFFINVINVSAIVIFNTRDFWLSIPWWVYLFATGVLLISYASISELRDNSKKLLNNIKISISKWN